MLGEPLSISVQNELRKRARGLNRENYGQYLEGQDYSFAEMMTKTTYVRLVSPRFNTQIEGTLFNPNGGLDNFNKKHWTDSERGIVPPPGITSVRTAYVGEGATINTIKEATIEMKVFSNEQYNVVVPKFVRIGTILYLEFGWSNPQIDIMRAQAIPRDFLVKTLNPTTGEYDVSMNYAKAQTFPDEYAINTNGNSDVFVGTVTNYQAKLNQEGGYDLSIDMKTSGHGLYHSSTNKNRPQNIALVKGNNTTGDPFANNLDERNGLILLSKIKANIQEVFDIKNIFGINIYVPSEKDPSVNTIKRIDQPSVYYSRIDWVPDNLEKIKEGLSSVGFNVEDRYGRADGGGGVITAVHESKDLIITMTRGEDTKVGVKQSGWFGTNKPQEKVASFYINYFVSVKYAEDNILSRLFGMVDTESSRLVSGVRSIRIPTYNDGFKIPDDNDVCVFASNLMLTHEQLIPINFSEVLINTEAMQAVLNRSLAGVYESKDGEDEKTAATNEGMFRGYLECLSSTLQESFDFIVSSEKSGTTTAENSVKEKSKNPKHVMANMRNMYVNVNVIQDAFLGTNNRNFCDRNFWPSTDNYQQDAIQVDLFVDDSVSYFQDQNVTFDKNSCVGTLREGLENMWNTISSNFHGFPNFEVGGNVFLPGFLSVYDLRNVKTNDYFTFEVYSKNSIVKSLELNSKIPKNVELAATIGASGKFDLSDALGGVNSGINAELLQDIKEDNSEEIESRYNPIYALSYAETNYFSANEFGSGNQIVTAGYADVEANIVQAIEAGIYTLPEGSTLEQVRNSVYDGATLYFTDGSQYSAKTDKGTISDASLNYLEVTPDHTKESWQGIAPDFILQNRPASDISDKKKTSAQRTRDKYPDINKGLTEISDIMDELFKLEGTDNKIDGELMFETSGGEVTPTISETESNPFFPTTEGIRITGIPVTMQNKTIKYVTLNQFHIIRGGIEKGGPDSRKVGYMQVNTHSDYQSYMDQMIYNDNVQSLEKLNNTISYFELSFKIDGISGILPGQAFTVSYLPDIVKRNFFFIVKNIEQTLGPEGWETSITGLMRRRQMPLPKIESKLKAKVKKVEKKQKENIKPQTVPTPVPTEPPLPDPGRPNIPIPSEDEDIAGNQDVSDLSWAEFEDPPVLDEPPPPPQPEPIPPVNRPDIPVPGHDAEFEPDVTPDDFDTEFPSFDDWEVPPPPQPFVPYEMVENDTANIILSMTDGMASIEPFENSPKQDIKIYPKGRPNAHPIIFSMGVTDILSVQEFQNIRRSYFESFGKDPEQLLNRLYTRFTYDDTMKDKDKDKKNFGEWDKREKTYFYVANRKDKDGKSIANKLERLIHTLRQSGNDPNNETGVENDFFNDAINAMLNQPERTKLTILKEKKNIKVKKRRKAIVDPSTRQPQDDPPPNPKPKKKKPKPEPKPTSFYGGLPWQNNLLYRVVPKWKTLGAVLRKSEDSITQADRTGVIQAGTYYKNEIMYGGPKESKAESAIPFDVRRTFWDSMIEKPEPGGHSSKSQKGRCGESETFLKNDNSYKYLQRLKGPKVSDSVKTYQKRF